MGNLRKLFGERLRALRLGKGLTQEQLAVKAGVHSTYIGIIERGKQSVSLDIVERIAKALSVTELELFSFISRKYPTGEKEKLIVELEDILKRHEDTDNIRKLAQICRIVLSGEGFSLKPVVAEKKAKYGKGK
jgi:transcriptional regulator with XRE-family HTH domain